MKPRLTASDKTKSSPSRAVLLCFIVGIFSVLVLGLRVLTPHSVSSHDYIESQGFPHGPDNPLVKQHRLELETENRVHAYTHAQQFVRAELLSGAMAHFPDITNPELEIKRLLPHHYRVRALVAWRDRHGALQQRRFETDLQHGPADSQWRLMDTEFLDTPGDTKHPAPN